MNLECPYCTTTITNTDEQTARLGRVLHLYRECPERPPPLGWASDLAELDDQEALEA